MLGAFHNSARPVVGIAHAGVQRQIRCQVGDAETGSDLAYLKISPETTKQSLV